MQHNAVLFLSFSMLPLAIMAQSCASDSGPDNSVPEDDYCRQLVQALCVGYVNCCGQADQQRYQSRSSCVTTETQACRDAMAQAEATLEFDGQGAARTLESVRLATTTCADLPQMAPPFAGAQSEFAACTADEQCAGEMWCKGSLCVRPGRRGAGCDPLLLPCDPDAELFCQPNPPGTIPTVEPGHMGPIPSGVCVSLPNKGEACAGACRGEFRCGPVAVAPGAPPMSSCQARLLNGSACTLADDCASQYCQLAAPVASAVPAASTCGACTRNRDCEASGEFSVCIAGRCSRVEDGSLEESDPCLADAQCASGHCLDGFCVKLTQDEIYCMGTPGQPSAPASSAPIGGSAGAGGGAGAGAVAP